MKFSQEEIRRLTELALIEALIKAKKKYYIPAAVSNRHVHLSAKDTEVLFGKGYELNKIRALSQPNQYACKEQVTLIGSKGSIERVRVLGPVRTETQLELSITDAYKVGIEPVVRISGDLHDTPGGRVVGPAGEVLLNHGVIVARRHIHMSKEQAAWFDVTNGAIINLRRDGERPVVFEDVLVRSGDKYDLEMHIDTDEANAAMIKNGDFVEMIK